MLREYILGLDMGSTSLGWCIVFLKNGMPAEFGRFGVRIFSDGRENKSKEPLSVARRTARGMRRRRDRYLKRRERLMNKLIQYGLMPADEKERKNLEKKNPYELRAKALDEVLPSYELGRALFHINQRRGFKSNMKTDRKDAEAGAMKAAIKETRGRLAQSGARTYGEYLYLLNKDKKSTQDFVSVRARSVLEKGKALYSIYPDRAMYEDEIRQIFEKQPLSQAIKDDLFDTIFFQRKLRPVELGFCQFEEGQIRAYIAFPAFQKSRALQQLNQLYLQDDTSERPLTDEERAVLRHYLLEDFSKLDKNYILTWSAIRKLLKPFGVSPKVKFNLESERRKGLQADKTSALMSGEDCFGRQWFSFEGEKQNQIVALILEEEQENVLCEKLWDLFGLPEAQAVAVSAVSLPDGVGSLSLKALNKILPFLEQGLLYDKAVASAGYEFSRTTKGKLPERYNTFIDPALGCVYDELPYYGQALPKQVIGGTNAAEDKNNPEKFYGKINNPTVHIALNQLRRLVNEVVKEYGHPSSVVIELARELKQNKEQKKKQEKEQAANEKENQEIAKKLETLGVKNNYDNRMKYKLWTDAAKDVSKRCCPFCGEQISMEKLFSDAFEIEHLLPFSRSYLDGRANKVISCRACNREKGNRSPFEAFAGDAARWNDILGRIELLPENKRWKFKSDAFERISGKPFGVKKSDGKIVDNDNNHIGYAGKNNDRAYDFEGNDIGKILKTNEVIDDKAGVLARMMADTRYMSRIAREYLCFAAHPSQVFGIQGQLTAKLREHWGLNSILCDEHEKDRTDHRHHAVDAFVVACTNRGILQKYSTERRDYCDGEMPQEKAPHLPFDNFRLAEIKDAFDNIIISHKPDHGNPQKAAKEGRTVAKLHEETYYGMAGEGDKKGTWKLIQRIPVTEFKTADDLEIIIDQAGTAAPLYALLEGLEKSEHPAVIADYFAKRGVRKVRTYRERNKDVILSFADKNGRPYRYAVYGGNAYAEVYCPDRGKNAGKWQIEIIPNYCAHQKGFVPQWRHEHAHAKLIMRLFKNDMVAYEDNGKTVIARVYKMDGANGIYLRTHSIAKEEKSASGMGGPKMQSLNLRKISVDIMGRITDPGKPAKESENGQDH